MGWHNDEETNIHTLYNFFIEGVEVDFNDSWCPGATISLNEPKRYGWDNRASLYTTIDCPKVLRWTPPARSRFRDGVEIEYLEDGYMCREGLATENEADEIASRAAYDANGLDIAHITITHTLSVGTSTVWIEVERERWYYSPIHYNVRLVVEFGNSEGCTRFLHGDMRKLERRYISEVTNVDVIGDIMRALNPITDDLLTAHKNALRRGLPFSQFRDECPQPKTQLIRHPASNRAYDRPCYVTLDITIIARMRFYIDLVDWSATKSPPLSPSRSNAFQSLDNIHLNFPSSAWDDRRNNNPSSRNSPGPLNFTVEASGIHGLTGTNSVARGNSITISSEHRNVHVNLADLPVVNININFISGDNFSGVISGGNVGGRNNVNTIMVTPAESWLP